MTDRTVGNTRMHVLSKDDETCLKLGREIVRMIHDVRKVAGNETGYANRQFTFPGGEVTILVVNDKRLAGLMHETAARFYDVQLAVPPSTLT